MKKQLLLALMLFAFIFPSEIAQGKDAHFSSLQQSTTKQTLIARWLTPRRQNKKRIGKQRGIKRLNLRRFTQRRSVKKRSRVRVNFRRFSPRRLIQRRVRRKKGEYNSRLHKQNPPAWVLKPFIFWHYITVG